MNIWILNHYAISPRFSGGSRHFDLAQQLVKKGHTVRIFASSFNHFERKETIVYSNSKFKNEEISGVTFTWISTPPYEDAISRVKNIIFYSLRLNRILKKELKKNEPPDVILGSSVHPLTPLVGIKRAKKSGALFYFEERDLWPQTFIDFGILKENSIISKVLFKIEKYLYENCDRVIFLFDRAHIYAESKGLAPEKHITLPNGFNSNRFQDNNSKINQNLKTILRELANKKLCIYTGSMGVANHMFPLLELAKEMKNEDFHFLYVGNGDQKQKLVEYKERENLQNVSFVDSIPKEQIPALLECADFGLISMKDSPLYRWGFSMNKIYDYLAAGLPIIMYSNVEYIGSLEGNDAILKSTSIRDMKFELLNRENIDRELIRRDAYGKYSWDILSEKLLRQVEIDMRDKVDKSYIKM